MTTEILAPTGGPQQKFFLAIQFLRNEEVQNTIYSGALDINKASDNNGYTNIFSSMFSLFLNSLFIIKVQRRFISHVNIITDFVWSYSFHVKFISKP